MKRASNVISEVYTRQSHIFCSVSLGLAPLDPDEIDLVKFPRVAEVGYFIAELEEGDMMYIPQFWYHQVTFVK